MQDGDKLLVEIIGKDDKIRKKKCVYQDGFVIIRKENKRKGIAEDKAGVSEDCFLYNRAPFGLLKRKVMLMENAAHCIKWDGKGVKDLGYDIRARRQYFDSNTFKKAGITQSKVSIPAWLVLLIIINIALTAITLLASGKIRFG